jgi:hypothetical protein
MVSSSLTDRLHRPDHVMTESEWLTCTDPSVLLQFIRANASERKLRLFACAYARQGHRLDDLYEGCYGHRSGLTRDERVSEPEKGAPFGEWGEQIVERAEMHADSQSTTSDLELVRQLLEPHLSDARVGAAYCGPSAYLTPEKYELLWATAAPEGSTAAELAIASVSHYFVGYADSGPLRQLNPTIRDPARRETLALQAELFRELFGNPFRPVAIDPAWRQANDGTVVQLAQAIYEDRSFEAMPILADALLDAGCQDGAILEHCHAPREHVKGCWVVDLILSKDR